MYGVLHRRTSRPCICEPYVFHLKYLYRSVQWRAKEMSFRGSTKMGLVGLLKTMRCLKRQPLTNCEQMNPESLSTLPLHSHRTQSICTDTSCFGGRQKKSGKLEQMACQKEKKNARKIGPGFAKNKNIIGGWRNNKIRRTTTKNENDAKLARRHTTVFQLSQVCQLVGPKNSAK